MEIVLATWNSEKMRWLSQGFDRLSVESRPLRPGEAEDADENGDTFEANALLKAHAIPEAENRIVVAEDSGLCVDALGGQPGVRTARWAPGSDDDRSLLLLERLTGVEPARRGAAFVSAVAVRFPDGGSWAGRGELRGRIALAPRGDRADGYARIFELPGGRTIAELGPDVVEPHDHRRQALALAAARIGEWLASNGAMRRP